jgi:site-specific DNA-cytosine methylase
MFCGAGVLSSGLEESGLANICWGLDSDEQCIESFKANFPNASGLQMTADKLLQLLLNVCTCENYYNHCFDEKLFCREILKMKEAKPCLQEGKLT